MVPLSLADGPATHGHGQCWRPSCCTLRLPARAATRCMPPGAPPPLALLVDEAAAAACQPDAVTVSSKDVELGMVDSRRGREGEQVRGGTTLSWGSDGRCEHVHYKSRRTAPAPPSSTTIPTADPRSGSKGRGPKATPPRQKQGITAELLNPWKAGAVRGEQWSRENRWSSGRRRGGIDVVVAEGGDKEEGSVANMAT